MGIGSGPEEPTGKITTNGLRFQNSERTQGVQLAGQLGDAADLKRVSFLVACLTSWVLVTLLLVWVWQGTNGMHCRCGQLLQWMDRCGRYHLHLAVCK